MTLTLIASDGIAIDIEITARREAMAPLDYDEQVDLSAAHLVEALDQLTTLRDRIGAVITSVTLSH